MKLTEIHEPSSLVIADKLLSIGAIRFNDKKPFLWSSGWVSPVYCDNRLALSYPTVRTYIKNFLADAITHHFHAVECIAGVATAGIPHGALVADALHLPYIYVRDKPKGHGMQNQIEGRVEPGKHVVLIDDLISTCGSSLRAAKVLTEGGYAVMGLAAIFTYNFPIVEKNLKETGLSLVCLSSFDYLINRALERGHLSQHQVDRLTSWRACPEKWR